MLMRGKTKNQCGEIKVTRKILKISNTPLITSECWTYYKFAIMQTSEYFNDWIAGHMRMFIDKNGNALFGESGTMYPLSYYSEILKIGESRIGSVKSNEICQYLVDHINQGEYIILDLNYEKLYDDTTNDVRLHETLIFGYDLNEQVFFTPLLKNHVFEVEKIPFNTVISSYEDALNYYRQDFKRIFNRRIWFYGITLIKPKYFYENTNKYFDLISKLKFQLAGKVFTQKNFFSEQEENSYFTGISATKYFTELLKNKLDSQALISEGEALRFAKSCLKIHENQKIIYESLKWFFENIGGGNENFSLFILEYEKNCKKTSICVSLLYKYLVNRQESLLLRTVSNLEEIYTNEKHILENLITICSDVYTKKLL